jgi:hypothetical protein
MGRRSSDDTQSSPVYRKPVSVSFISGQSKKDMPPVETRRRDMSFFMVRKKSKKATLACQQCTVRESTLSTPFFTCDATIWKFIPHINQMEYFYKDMLAP